MLSARLAPVCLAAILSIAGGCSELVGLVIVMAGIVRDQRRAGDLFRQRPAPKRRSRQYGPHQFPRSTTPLASGVSTTARDLRGIAASVARIEAAAYNAFIDMQKAFDTQLDESINALREQTTDADNELRGHLRYVLAGSARDRWFGVAFLALGIALATAGSVAGAS